MFLEIKGIKKSFGTGDSRVNVLKGLDLEIERGEFCVLLGPSGSGKSTLLNIIGGIDGADEGSITIDGEQLEDMTEKKLSLYRRKHLGYIFQMYNLIPNLTLRENIEVGAYLSDRPLDVDELMHTLGIYEHQNKLPNQLSGGQQQRTAIGRAIVKNPDILLCDEPTGALDYNTSKEILKLIETVNQKYGNTIVMVTHNDAIKDMADRVVKLRDGMIRMDWVDTATLDLEDVYYPAGHRAVLCVRFSTDPFTEYTNEAIWGMVELVKVMRKERSVVMNDRRLFVNKTQLCVGESQYTVQCSNNEHSE